MLGSIGIYSTIRIFFVLRFRHTALSSAPFWLANSGLPCTPGHANLLMADPAND